jgi:hypothetical protein
MLDFIDETGDHNLIKIDPDFPLFGLGAIIISKSEYKKLNIGIENIKKKYFKNPKTFILHSAELTRPDNFKSDPRNMVLENAGTRRNFYADIDCLLSEIEFKLVACFVLKNKIKDPCNFPIDPYHFSFEILLNRIIKYGSAKNIITVENRDKKLNNELVAEYERFCKVGIHKYTAKAVRGKTTFQLKNKRENINGLQVIDLIMATLSRKFLGKPEKPKGNGVSLQVIENKLIEVSLFPKKSPKAKDPPATQ